MSFGNGASRGGLVGLFALGVAVAPCQAQTTQYAYDALGRLVSAIDQDGKKVAYTYDNAGNRTRLSNGAEFQEIIPTAFTASSNAGTTGLTTTNGMKDGVFTTLASVHATNTETGAWIQADLGSVKNVNHIEIAPAVVAGVNAGVEDVNGATLEYSVDGTIWKVGATANGLSAGATQTISLGGVALRYLRVKRAGSGQVALGDFRLFSAAAANSPLIAEPDSITSTGAAVTFNPMANDRDQDGHAFTITSVEDPPNGTAVINGGATITYTPDAGYFGADSFLYTIADGHNGTASARVSVLVRSATNHAPVAVADQFTVGDRTNALVDGIQALRPLDNDYDSDGDVLTITARTTPAHGVATLSGGNLIEYQPTVGYTGPDSFNYTISDGRGLTASAAITLSVGNAKPVATDDAATTPRNTSIVLRPQLNDSDPNGDPITITAVTTPTNGVATLNLNQTVTYAPKAGFTGSDSFTYSISDGRGESATGTVNLTVTPPLLGTLEVMQPELYAKDVTISDGVFTSQDSIYVNVYSPQSMTTGKHYWEVMLKCGALLPGVANNIAIARAYGGYSSRNAGIHTYYAYRWSTSASATSIGGGALNDVYGFALDADAMTLRVYKNNVLGTTITLPFGGPYYAHSGLAGSVTLAGQACPAGAAEGQFLLGAGNTTYAAPATYTANPPSVANIAPVAIADEATLPANAWITFDPKGNDIDQNGDALSYSAIGAASHGVVDNLGAFLRYTPTTSYVGPDSFSYTVTDGRGGTSTATVSLVVVAASAKTFSISPAVSSKTTWNLAVDGPLDLSSGGTWTIIPNNTFSVSAKVWGGGGGSPSGAGAGGHANGSILLTAGVSYKIHVGGGGVNYGAGGANGGGAGGGSSYKGSGGGGYSGLRYESGASVLIAGGGGGAGWGGVGGAGGGASGAAGGAYAAAGGGVAGTATTGAGQYQGGAGGSADTGGGGGGGGWFGGGGGGADPGVGGGGGGGGSGYLNARDVVGGALVAGSGSTPGASSDAARGSAGDPTTAGRVIISP